jgi:hypothetical protein
MPVFAPAKGMRDGVCVIPGFSAREEVRVRKYSRVVHQLDQRRQWPAGLRRESCEPSPKGLDTDSSIRY